MIEESKFSLMIVAILICIVSLAVCFLDEPIEKFIKDDDRDV
ncbi:hypothetical protein bthur0014_57890 [Bacillus thuringiensis IBL 4222]|uniref:Uncharacterized protein n=2 Tax=Bacillus thuringiensis TaxID=1428 RepID=A0A9W3JSX3_BACTU|nr:hypothetical protein BTF1_15315 [Bacillus thuringiensis HD-789]AJH07928.1 hypothetical protein AS86_445 [Bacillus thuringiensis HD1002]EEM99574.1 hypothetical protein bthur0014_57890 [Bacillus thuringiensis IBL 4222]RCX41247.1 hypothetical protein DEU45_102942 [Bacillus sp. AG102]TWE76040.1 hypothetical protein FHW38_102943 [Bacillus thuringiensis]TWG44308.1 hypothetical protein FHX98_3238 [Bacillus sp. AK8]VIJ05278.1 hypothetical protein BTAR23_AR23_03556 [Bacillus thuringiensis serovar i